MTENSTPQSLTPIWAVFSCVGLCDSNLIILTGKWMSANSLFYSPIVQTAGIPTCSTAVADADGGEGEEEEHADHLCSGGGK